MRSSEYPSTSCSTSRVWAPSVGAASGSAMGVFSSVTADRMLAMVPPAGCGMCETMPNASVSGERRASATVRTAPAVWFFLLPNAVMEEMEIARFLRTHQRAGVHKYQLPNSDPQTLWFVLMEQLGKVQKVSDYFNEERSDDNMNTNLKASMDTAMTIDGALAVALVDHRSGMCLAQAGGGMNLDLAAAGNTQVVKAKLQTMETLGIRKGIEDILITLADQYHLIRLVPNAEGLFLYLVLDRNKGNLALARYKLTDIERSLKV